MWSKVFEICFFLLWGCLEFIDVYLIVKGIRKNEFKFGGSREESYWFGRWSWEILRRKVNFVDEYFKFLFWIRNWRC